MENLNNHYYNLFNQLVEEQKTLWRIQKFYLKDSKGCKKCLKFWKEFEKLKSSQAKEIFNLIKEHLK